MPNTPPPRPRLDQLRPNPRAVDRCRPPKPTREGEFNSAI